jgi:hypothetical protein
MKSSFLVFVVVFFVLCSAHAQTIMGFNVTEIVSSITTGLKGVGLVPDLQSLGSPETKAFFIILILMWMVFNIAIGISDLPSAIFSFFLTSFLFNHIPSLFLSGTAEGLFEYVFSALFVFIWVDYLLHYMWAISRTTKLFMGAAITMIALLFLNFTNIFTLLEGWVTSVLSVFGFIMFIFFMAGMRVFNTYFSMMNLRSAKALRRAGATRAKRAKGDVTTTREALEEMGGK